MLPDLFGDSATPGVRRPRFEVAFGAGAAGSDSGLLSEAASAIGIGSAEGEDPWARSVARIAVDMGIAPAVDFAEIVLSGDGQAPSVVGGDTGAIALGYEDEGATAVFTGSIESIRRGAPSALRLTITNATATLAALRVEQSYEDQAAGAIVEDLAGRAGTSTGHVADGPTLSFVVLDGGRSVWEHIAHLARVSGHLARVNADGELDFAPPDAGEAVRTFTWGGDILRLDRTDAPAPFDAVTIAGEGAAGSQGKDAWNWLAKQPAAVTGNAGTGSRNRAFADRALRSADAVRAAANALADAAARAAVGGTLVVAGAPAVVPGRRIALHGAAAPFAGTYLVTRVRHSYDKRNGFRSRITFTGGGGGGGSLLGGLL